MKPILLIPVKDLRAGKSRLRGALSEEERRCLNLQLIHMTLQRANLFPGCGNSYVVTESPEVGRICGMYGIRPLLVPASSGLNGGLHAALSMIGARVHEGVLILPVDLPLATKDDCRLICQGGSTDEVVICPDRQGRGTNALVLPPDCGFSFSFGTDSRWEHEVSARRLGLKTRIVTNAAISFDLDEPEDLAILAPTLFEMQPTSHEVRYRTRT